MSLNSFSAHPCLYDYIDLSHNGESNKSIWFIFLISLLNLTLMLLTAPLTLCLIIIQEPEELFETISQALLSSVDRDCLSGWGGHVYVV